MHTQIVVVPGFNDGKWLERSIGALAKLWPAVRSISLVPVGLTRHHKYDMRVHRKDEAMSMIRILDSIQAEFKQDLGVNLIYLTDEWFLRAGLPVPLVDYYDDLQLHENGLGMVRSFLNEWNSLQKEIEDLLREDNQAGNTFLSNRLTLVTGTLFGPTLTEISNQFAELIDVKIDVIPIVNQRLGDTITVSGLLMADDILNDLAQRDLGELVVLPRIAFDHPEGISLDDVSPSSIATQVKRPVALADSMGDVWDAITGNSRLVYEP
jgi:NifB/MoaA-like Fe-S oxidoreductase